MLLWFLTHIDQHLEWRGMQMLAYRYWHPTDHIFFKILGTPGPGCRFHIVEAFQANPKYLIDISFDVPKLDLTGFRLEFRRLGQIITSMDEDFEDIPEGMRYKVTMTIGSTAPLLRTVTRLVRTHVLAATLCVFRPSRTPIPGEAEHRFRAKPNTRTGQGEHPGA